MVRITSSILLQGFRTCLFSSFFLVRFLKELVVRVFLSERGETILARPGPGGQLEARTDSPCPSVDWDYHIGPWSAFWPSPVEMRLSYVRSAPELRGFLYLNANRASELQAVQECGAKSSVQKKADASGRNGVRVLVKSV